MRALNMHATINTKLLRSLPFEALPSELKTLRLQLPDDAITEQLLHAIERGSLAPSIFDSWLRVCLSPSVVKQALTQKVSIRIRILGIRQLKSGFLSQQWEEFWNGLGGTAGLLDIFSDLSVLEIKAACKAIGRCARIVDADTKRERVTELFRALHPSTLPDAAATTKDKRPLTKFYQALVPICTPETVLWVMSEQEKGNWQHVSDKKLFEAHPDIMQTVAMRALHQHQMPDAKGKDRLKKLWTRYPSDPRPESGFSASMDFAFRTLRTFAEVESSQLEVDWVIASLVQPLLRRAVRKHCTWPRTQEIVAVIMQFLENNPSAARTLTNRKGDVLHMVAVCWSRRSALFEKPLERLLQIVYNRNIIFEDVRELFSELPRSRRYALLHLICKEVMEVDLNSEHELSKARGRLSPGLLSSLEAPDALGLFQRLRRARGDVDLVDMGSYSSVLMSTRNPGTYEGDPEIYYLVLLNRSGRYQEAESYAAEIMDVRKKKVRTASNRDIRAEHAISVWACATASGSLALLSETVQWAKGFIRDQLTASKLFSTYYDETYQLLSGYVVQGNATFRPQDVRQRVELANAIVIDLLGIARSATREPHFQPSDWRRTLELFTWVVKARIQRSVALQPQATVLEDCDYHDLWEDTITMLLRAEELLNDEESEKLRSGTISGVITWKSVFSDISLAACGNDVWHFVDDLAKARDVLWMKLRPARYPEVLTLPEPFPRGLPVQGFLSTWTPQAHNTPQDSAWDIPTGDWEWGYQDPMDNWIPNTANLPEKLPYIYSRAKQTLFMDPKAALRPVSSDKSVQQSIGVFVDSYAYALRLYIPDICDYNEKEKRLSEVWAHVTGPLSKQRLNESEAVRYWKRFVPSYLQPTLSKIVPEKSLSLPYCDDTGEVLEWNPFDANRIDTSQEARSLGNPTYVDLTTLGVQTRLVNSDVWSYFVPPRPTAPEHSQSFGSIWNDGTYAAGSESHEAAALAALLYLDAKYGMDERLLDVPFPSSDDARYPCLYLDHGFLASESVTVFGAAHYAGLSCAPLPLVRKVASTLVKRLDTTPQSSRTVSQEDAAFELVRVLNRSDRPSFAFDLIVKIVTGQPDASSWHRGLFSNGLLQRLPASDASRCISEYAAKIGERLRTQKLLRTSELEVHEDEADASADAPMTETTQQKEPRIKVTTLKALAQILHGSLYIGDDDSLKILSDLSQQISHIDVRVSILRTLLSKLDAARPDLWEGVISTLATFVPLVGSLDEREPSSQGDLDSTGSHKTSASTLHSVKLTTSSGWQTESPMLESVLSHFNKIQNGQLLTRYLERILIPIVDCLEEQIAKWTTIFLQKYASNDTDVFGTVLPPTPKGTYIVDAILSKSGTPSYRVPQALLDKHVAYLIYRVEPPEPFRRLNQALQTNRALKSRPEVETWLELYGQCDIESWQTVLPFDRTWRFEKHVSDTTNPHITIQAYREAFFEVFKRLVLADGPAHNRLGAFTSTMYESGVCRQPEWKYHGRPMIENMIAYVQGIRTLDWERNSHRSPDVLPDVFYWQLNLLSNPEHHKPDLVPDEEGERECEVFAQQLASTLDKISGSVYHEQLQSIKNYVRTNRYALLTALYLGDISRTRLSWLTAPDLLRVDLAAYMMLDSRRYDVTPLEGRLKELLGTWIASDNEDVRRVGYKVRTAYLDANGDRIQKTGSW